MEYEILTEDGFKDFSGLKKSYHNEFIKLIFKDQSTFICSKDHKVKVNDKFIKAMDLKLGDKLEDKELINYYIITTKTKEIFYDPINVKDTSSYISNGISHHNCDEAAFIDNKQFHQYLDSVMPAMAAIPDSQAIFSSTAKGLNHFYHLVEAAKKKKVNIIDNIEDEEDTVMLKDGTIVTMKEFYTLRGK